MAVLLYILLHYLCPWLNHRLFELPCSLLELLHEFCLGCNLHDAFYLFFASNSSWKNFTECSCFLFPLSFATEAFVDHLWCVCVFSILFYFLPYAKTSLSLTYPVSSSFVCGQPSEIPLWHIYMFIAMAADTQLKPKFR